MRLAAAAFPGCAFLFFLPESKHNQHRRLPARRWSVKRAVRSPDEGYGFLHFPFCNALSFGRQDRAPCRPANRRPAGSKRLQAEKGPKPSPKVTGRRAFRFQKRACSGGRAAAQSLLLSGTCRSLRDGVPMPCSVTLFCAAVFAGVRSHRGGGRLKAGRPASFSKAAEWFRLHRISPVTRAPRTAKGTLAFAGPP